MKKTFACAVRPNKAPSMRRGLSIISLEHSYGLNGSRIFDRTQLAPKCKGPLEGLGLGRFGHTHTAFQDITSSRIQRAKYLQILAL